MMCLKVPATRPRSPQINLTQTDVRAQRNTAPTRRSTMSAECLGQATPPFAFPTISRNSSPDTIPTAARRLAMS